MSNAPAVIESAGLQVWSPACAKFKYRIDMQEATDTLLCRQWHSSCVEHFQIAFIWTPLPEALLQSTAVALTSCAAGGSFGL